MIHSVEKDEKNFQLYPSDDIYVVGSLLKVLNSVLRCVNFAEILSTAIFA